MLLLLKELSMRRPGPQGQTQLKESFGGSSVQALLEVTSAVRGERELKSALATIVKTVAEALAFKTVVLNLYRPEFDDFCVTDVYGSKAARNALLGSTYEWGAWRHLLTEEFRRGGAYLIPHGSFDWSDDIGTRYVPEIEPSEDPDAWHPEDELFVPLEDSDGRMLAIFSVGEPRSGRRPNAAELEVLCALAAHAAIAIETAQQSERTARHRASLEQLLEVSSTLTAAQSTQAILETVCRGIHTALGFQKVSIELVDVETGLLRSRASCGWPADDPAVLRAIPFDPMRALLEPEFEVSGCYLVPNAAARERIDAELVTYSSQSNGRGPHAWNHHWLLVPLYDRAGQELGLIWADDPEDRLVPTAERLQALRVFANQATTALYAAEQFEQLRFLADHDPLTNLLNRRSFVQHLDAEVNRSRRYDRPLALVIFDLDELKTVNDTRGHAAGDEALQGVGDSLRATIRGGDNAFRIGGDEFAVLLPEATEQEAVAVAQRIADELQLAASFGVAVCSADGDAGALLREADDAMYRMKRRQRGETSSVRSSWLSSGSRAS
jgi:diguanylate cyclase (GGDEF)-like protein